MCPDAKAVGMSRTTIHAGFKTLKAGSVTVIKEVSTIESERTDKKRLRAIGGGRKTLTDKDMSLLSDLDALIAPSKPRDPMSPLRWTFKSTTRLAEELRHKGHTTVSPRTICDLLS